MTGQEKDCSLGGTENDTIGYMIRRGLDLASEGQWSLAAVELAPLTDFRNLTISDMERAFPLARPRPPLAERPTGRRLHPKHLHDTDRYGPSCFVVGCPAWCWSGHPMSYGDDAPSSPENVEEET